MGIKRNKDRRSVISLIIIYDIVIDRSINIIKSYRIIWEVFRSKVLNKKLDLIENTVVLAHALIFVLSNTKELTAMHDTNKFASGYDHK